MMQAADLGGLNDATTIDGMNRSPFRAVHPQCLVSEPVVIVAEVGGKDPLQMPLVDHDDMIEAFSPDRSDQPLDIGVLPRASR